MRSVTVTWQREEGRFDAEGTHRDFVIPVNAPGDGPATGFSPTELLLAGVGACSAWDVVEILRKQRQHLTGVEVEVAGDQAADPPWPYERIEVRFVVRGDRLDRSRVQRAVDLSVERYCSVIATVRGVADVVSTLEVVDDRPGSIPTDAVAGQAGTEA